MRNPEMDKLAVLVGTWKTKIHGAWFLDSLDAEVIGTTTFEWLGESLILWRSEFEGDDQGFARWTIVLGRSDATERFRVLYEDGRGVCREYAMTYDDDGHWTLSREDPDMHQRLVADIHPDRIEGRWEASEDAGTTWRKDFDLTFERTATP
jgi:hypothetical protein